MAEPKTFDVSGFLDTRRVGRAHVSVVALLLLTMMVDGYDIFLVGNVLPAITADLGIDAAAFTIVFVVQQFGLLIGNLIVGPLADRYGRRVTLLGCLVIFGALTFGAISASTVTEFVVWRFVAGIFFSGVIPNAIALVSEIMPTRIRATSVSITFAGYTLGSAVIGAPVLRWLVPMGWEYAFVVGGALPIVLAVVLYFTLPESLRFLAGRNPRDPQIPRLLRRIDSSLELSGEEVFVMRSEAAGAGAAGAAAKVTLLQRVAALFHERRWTTTVLLWGGFHMAFIVSNLMGAWKNTVLSEGGVPIEQVAWYMFVQGIAGVVGTLTAGFVMDRFGAARVLPVYLGAASAAIGAVAFTELDPVATTVAFVVAGYFSNGGLSGLNAFAAISYPSQIRATGVSWAHGAGRAGAMIGPILGGAMIAREMGVSGVFLVTAIPQMCAALAIVALWRTQAARLGAEKSVGR